VTSQLLDMRPVQSFNRRRFRWRGAAGGAVLIPAAIASLFLSRPSPATSAFHLTLQSVAWACFVAGCGFRFWATLYIGGHKEHELVTTGPYSVCRHPLYLGSFLLGVSGSLFVEGPLLLVGVLVVASMYVWGTMPVEEAVLRARHGSRYDAYARDVPRLVPRRWTVNSPREITVDVHRLWLECARASRWVWLPLLGAVTRYLRTMAWWPRPLLPF
jgi:protein-S-isoprenylcysteine O-methyltransferase Ste14